MNKKKAKLHVLKTPERLHFHDVVEHAGKIIDQDTFAVAFFVMKKDRTVTPGISYAAGFTVTDLQGGCEEMKTQLKDMVWPTNRK